MGYKASVGNFEEMYKDWADPKWWSSPDVLKDIFTIYGQAKLDCLIAGRKYREDLAGMDSTEDMFWELTEWIHRAELVNELIDEFLLTIINW